MHKLLKCQIAGYCINHNDLTPEILELFEVVSKTYEFYEEKYIQVQEQNQKCDPEIQSCFEMIA